jgi:D-alanine-D-alanine ligase
MALVGLVFGGRSVEHEVSIVSARTVAKALADAGHTVLPLALAQDGCWVGADASKAALSGGVKAIEPLGLPVVASVRHLLTAQCDVLFPITHGTWGEDGTLQGLFEMLDLAYVGAGVAASAVAMDKRLSKELHRAAGIPVVDFWAFGRGEWGERREAVLERLANAPLPLFVKPSVGGSSVGIRRVESAADLAAAIDFAFGFDDSVLIERGVVDGRELEVAVAGYPQLEAAHAIGEIVPGNEFYDYEDKYLSDRARLLAPAELDPGIGERLRALAVGAFAAIGGSGMARVDFFLVDEDGEPRLYVNEINTLPGFTRISMFPRLWELSGVSNAQLVDRLVRDAMARHADRRRLDSGIKQFLADLARREGAGRS